MTVAYEILYCVSGAIIQNSVFHAFPDGLDIKSVHFSVHFHNHQTEL